MLEDPRQTGVFFVFGQEQPAFPSKIFVREVELLGARGGTRFLRLPLEHQNGSMEGI